jgi:hypothetical protein
LTFTKVGRATAVSGIPSRVYQLIEQVFLEGRGTAKGKGGYNLGNATITFAPDGADAGHTLLANATKSDNAYSVKISHPKLGDFYAQALVLGGPTNFGDVNTAASQECVLEFTVVSDTEDGIVAVPVEEDDD